MENRKKIGKTKNEKYDTAKAKIGKDKKLEKPNFENTKLEHGKLKTKIGKSFSEKPNLKKWKNSFSKTKLEIGKIRNKQKKTVFEFRKSELFKFRKMMKNKNKFVL